MNYYNEYERFILCLCFPFNEVHMKQYYSKNELVKQRKLALLRTAVMIL